jgi:hypothetical protein
MGRSTAEIEREIAETRRSIEGQVVELRRQGRIQARRVMTAAVVVAGLAAAVGAAVVVYRLTRPITWRERARRLLPVTLPRRSPRDEGTEGQRVIVIEPEQTRWQRLAIEVAKAAGTAAGAAVVSRLLRGRGEAK